MSTDVEAPAVESTPLISGDTGIVNDDPPPLQEMKSESLKEKAITAGATFTFAASVASMLVETNPLVYGSGIVGCGVAPLAAIQQEKLTQCEALRQTNARLTSEVDILKQSNETLQEQVGQLEGSVKQ